MTSISAIPDIIRRSIFISEEENTKKNLHPYIDKYQYFLSGLKIKDNYFTVKSVIAIDQNNNRYYDHKLFNIEKSRLIDSLNKKEELLKYTRRYPNQTAPQKSSSIFNDKRLYEICQCPQAKFLDKNFEPNKAIVAQENIHPNIKTYSYFISGLQIEREIFTVKSVIGIDQANNKYYDHKVFDTEKSILIDLIGKRGSFDVHTSYTQTTAPQKSSSIFNDKRLYEICQCPTNSNCKEFLFSYCFIQSLQVTSAVKYRMKHRSDVLSNKRN